MKAMKMRNTVIVLAAILAAVSCNKSEQPAVQAEVKVICLGEDVRRTYLKDGADVVWAGGDAINILTASNNEKYTLAEGAGTTEGTFAGNAVSGEAYAVYPYNADATLSAGVITTTLGCQQNVKDRSFSNNTNLAVAKADNRGNFALKNVCGLLKIQIKGDNIGQIVITGNNDEDLAGKINISFNAEGEPVYDVVEGEKSITLKTYNGAVITPGTYYAVVLPQTFSKGITVTCKPYEFKPEGAVKQKNTPADLVKTGASALALGRTKIVPLGYVDAGSAWEFGKTGAPVRLAGLRSNDINHGLYLDFSTGRTFYAIGAYEYCAQCDLLMITNGSNGLAPCAPFNAAGFTNEANIKKFGAGYSSSDYISNWATKLSSKFCYVGGQELSEEQYNAITTVDQIKAIYSAHESAAVNTYYGSTPDVVTNANRGRMTQGTDTDTHKYLVIKTYSASEGAGYGIVKFTGVAGNPWYIELFYKWGLEAPAK